MQGFVQPESRMFRSGPEGKSLDQVRRPQQILARHATEPVCVVCTTGMPRKYGHDTSYHAAYRIMRDNGPVTA